MNIITFNKEDIKIDITFSKEENTIWMSQKEIGLLYGVDQKLVSKLIKKVVSNYDDLTSIFAKMEKNGSDGKNRRMNHYNLDIIKQIGYKIDPLFTNDFVSWVKEELNKLNNEIIPIQSNIIRFDNGNVVLDVTVEPMEQTVWMTQNQIAILFDTTQPNISQHITNIINENELADDSVHKESLYTAIDGKDYKVSWYNLDMILAIGYRTKTKKAIEFRRWVTRVLKLYINKDDNARVDGNDYIQLVRRIDKIDTRLEKVESEHEIIFPNTCLFKKESLIEAQSLLRNLISIANKDLVIVDPYVDEKTIEIVKSKKKNVKCTLITSKRHRIKENDLNSLMDDGIELLIDDNSESHDRYLIIDNAIYYNLGPSLNYFGYKMGNINKVSKKEDIATLMKYVSRFLNN